MASPSIEKQIQSVEFIARFVGRAPPKMRPAEIEEHAANLRAAIESLRFERERRQRGDERT